MSRLLIVEDEAHIASGLRYNLEADGHDVTLKDNGEAALAELEADPSRVDLVVLDVMLPDINGFTVAARMRARGWLTPILMLTARGRAEDVLRGFEAGADDYLPKPFELDELFARLRALLRRAAPVPEGTDRAAVLQVAGLRVDPAARRAWWGEQELQLSKTEFDLLELMVRNEGIVLDHSTVYQRIWGYDFGVDSKNLAVYIGYLRRKLAAVGAPALIHTVRGVGYAVRRP